MNIPSLIDFKILMKCFLICDVWSRLYGTMSSSSLLQIIPSALMSVKQTFSIPKNVHTFISEHGVLHATLQNVSIMVDAQGSITSKS